MKNIAIIIASMFLFATSVLAGKGTVNKKSINAQAELAEKISNMLGYPSQILNGSSQTVMIAYSIDENDIIHVDDVSGATDELKKYVIKHMDGKNMNKLHLEGKNGVVKVYFAANEMQEQYFQH